MDTASGCGKTVGGGGFRWGLATGVGLGMRVVVVAAPCPWVPAFAGTTVKVREGVGGGGRLWGLPRLGPWVPAYAGTTVWRYGVGVRGYVEWVCSWGGGGAPPLHHHGYRIGVRYDGWGWVSWRLCGVAGRVCPRPDPWVPAYAGTTRVVVVAASPPPPLARDVASDVALQGRYNPCAAYSRPRRDPSRPGASYTGLGNPGTNVANPRHRHGRHYRPHSGRGPWPGP